MLKADNRRGAPGSPCFFVIFMSLATVRSRFAFPDDRSTCEDYCEQFIPDDRKGRLIPDDRKTNS
jgi:hypothetical protein